MQFDLDLVFQIKNIEMWNKFPLDNDPQKYNSLIQRSPYSLLNPHTAQQSACAPRQGKNECEYTKTTRKYPREDFILTKKTKVRNRQTKTLAKSFRLKPVLWDIYIIEHRTGKTYFSVHSCYVQVHYYSTYGILSCKKVWESLLAFLEHLNLNR